MKYPTFNKSSTKIVSLILTSIFLLTISTNSSASNHNAIAPQQTGPAYIIFDNTAGQSNNAIMTNMATNQTPKCTKTNVLQDNSQNCFDLADNDIQIVQNDGTGNPVSMVGVNNSKSTSYNNTGDKNQTYLFKENEHIFDINGIRTAADNIAQIENLDIANTYGTMTFGQFLKNVAYERTMYGIVRVTIPLIKDPTTQQYKMTNERISSACRTCGPGLKTTLRAGSTICGYTLPETAQIKVNGTLMFDWVDCATDNPIPLSELPADKSQVTFGISVPLMINPANLDTNTLTMSTTTDILDITGTNTCDNTSTCEKPITTPISYSLIPQESKDRYEFKMDEPLTSTAFDALSRTDQYHLLFPSGYANGWEKALNTLNITPSTWRNWGFTIQTENGSITANDIRQDSFSDMPALIYSGGIISIKHHANISGLIYAAQAIEINQNGLTPRNKKTKRCVTAKKGNSDDGGSSDDDPSTKTNCNTTITTRAFIPSYQYINGSIVVRDGFYFEATKPGGITLISNNPDSYSNTKLEPGTGRRASFTPYVKALSSEKNNTTVDNTTPSGGNNGNNAKVADNSIFTIKNDNALPADLSNPQWVEIRPR